MQKDITIVGAGLVGSLLSIFLSKRAHKVTIYERRADMRINNAAAGRSINLALSDRGIRALEKAGLMGEVEKICIPMHGRYVHLADGSSNFQPYGKEGQYINSISRADLNILLLNACEQNEVALNFSLKCDQIDFDKNEISFVDGYSENIRIEKPDIIFGADGSYSASRLQHQVHSSMFDYHQFYIDYGYKELSIPPGKNGEFLLEKNALHIWPRGNYMLIALPNMNGSFTATLFFPFHGEPSFESLKTPDQVNEFFKTTFKDVFPQMTTLEEDYFTNPASPLVTVKCYPWVRDNHFSLIGDAAHAMVPFFGQGMNCGFEDCFVLDSLIEKYGDDWHTILEKFQDSRKPNADAIADMALNNFVEMRNKVADEGFILQKKIESWFAGMYPTKWIPAYSMVTFNPDISYSEALRRGQIQDRIMEEVLELENIKDDWKNSRVENAIISGYQKYFNEKI
ncbi:MAG: FAD-dependent monooxygenase [Bacteroidetes bacterium]|nr:FAD-dependent monooxygenase [Bacteroidota bacterium]